MSGEEEKREGVIVGGGISGLSLAYSLAKRGFRDVILLEKNFLASGATGSCAGGVRQQFSSPVNIELMKISLPIFEGMDDFVQGGYLFLAYDEKGLKELEENVSIQNELGVKSEMVTPEECEKISPYLNLDGVVGGSYNQKDGYADPFNVSYGYLFKAIKLGVQVATHEEVLKLMTDGPKVVTTKRRIDAEKIFVCAGAYTAQLLKPLGIKLPNQPIKHEIMVTETLSHFLDPMVVTTSDSFYAHQTARGEIITGVEMFHEPSFDTSSTFKFLTRCTQRLSSLFPATRKLKVLRQWAGLYDMVLDAAPVVGEVKGIHFMCGYSGHGFMVAPGLSELIADRAVYGKEHDLLQRLDYKRFEEGVQLGERAVIG
jgi:sarcosine oxidase subunit beta